jgi:hypothetical protein
MLDWLLLGIAAAAGGGTGGSAGGSAGLGDAGMAEAVVESAPLVQFEAEDQTPSGKFTTAGEIKMIMTATKPQWIAVRLYEGQDILYFTQLLSWRCGLHQIKYSVNGGAMQVYDMPPCHLDMAAPNAMIDNDAMPIMGLAPNSVQSVEVEILYDDLSTDSASYQRGQILIP